jgi:hypothetical protein
MSHAVCGVLWAEKLMESRRPMVPAMLFGPGGRGKQTREQKVEDMWICGSVYKWIYRIDKRGLDFILHSLVALHKEGPADSSVLLGFSRVYYNCNILLEAAAVGPAIVRQTTLVRGMRRTQRRLVRGMRVQLPRCRWETGTCSRLGALCTELIHAYCRLQIY